MFPAQLTENGHERTLQISVADQFWETLKLEYERSGQVVESNCAAVDLML